MQPPVIRLEGISKTFRGSVCAADSITLAVEAGEILALLGPSGSGKTTILRMIAGFERPDAGAIEVGGRQVSGPGLHLPAERRGVGIVFQDLALFPHLTVRENVAFGLRGPGWPGSRRERRVGEMLLLVGLEGLEDRYPHQLSGGQQQRVALARALAPEPAVVLLDEPFSSLDADLREQTRREVRQLFRRTGVTALVVTHDQREAFALADRIAVLRQGRIEQVDRPEVVYHQPASRFVADFVGQADFLRGRVEQGQLRTSLGSFAVPSATEGAELDLMVRPDHVHLAAEEESNASVVECRFLGDDTAVTLRLDDDLEVHSLQPSTTLYAVDTRLRAWAEPLSVVTFPPPEER